VTDVCRSGDRLRAKAAEGVVLETTAAGHRPSYTIAVGTVVREGETSTFRAFRQVVRGPILSIVAGSEDESGIDRNSVSSCTKRDGFGIPGVGPKFGVPRRALAAKERHGEPS
jgi:hypothetical protein